MENSKQDKKETKELSESELQTSSLIKNKEKTFSDSIEYFVDKNLKKHLHELIIELKEFEKVDANITFKIDHLCNLFEEYKNSKEEEKKLLSKGINALNKYNEHLVNELNDLKSFIDREKRNEKEKENQIRIMVIKDIFRCLDNLLLAYESCKSMETGKLVLEQENIGSFVKGMEMTLFYFEDNFFKKYHIEAISPSKTDKFDPNFHEALSCKNDDELEDNQIVSVVKIGHKIGEIVIRPAIVIVNKKNN